MKVGRCVSPEYCMYMEDFGCPVCENCGDFQVIEIDDLYDDNTEDRP